MKNPFNEYPLKQYFLPISIPNLPVIQSSNKPKITGISKFMKYLKNEKKEENGIFVTAKVSENCLKNTFEVFGKITKIVSYERYSFIIFENNVNIDNISNKIYILEGKEVFIDKIKGCDVNFIPKKHKRKINLWYNIKNKYKEDK